MTVTVPNSYFQVDFVCGNAIGQFGGTGSNVTYHAENRYLDGSTGGYETAPSAGFSNFTGFVYIDTNSDEIKDGSEAGVGNVTILLSGVDSQGNAVAMKTITVASGVGLGSYVFAGLQPGTYTVTVPTQPGDLTPARAR